VSDRSEATAPGAEAKRTPVSRAGTLGMSEKGRRGEGGTGRMRESDGGVVGGRGANEARERNGRSEPPRANEAEVEATEPTK